VRARAGLLVPGGFHGVCQIMQLGGRLFAGRLAPIEIELPASERPAGVQQVVAEGFAEFVARYQICRSARHAYAG